MDIADGILSIAILKCLGGGERIVELFIPFVHLNKKRLPNRRSKVMIFLNTIFITKDLLNFYFFLYLWTYYPRASYPQN